MGGFEKEEREKKKEERRKEKRRAQKGRKKRGGERDEGESQIRIPKEERKTEEGQITVTAFFLKTKIGSLK